jgi:malate dehydrogenase (oxaloacetate-decarboxylating)
MPASGHVGSAGWYRMSFSGATAAHEDSEILLVETFQKPGALASVLSVIADERLLIEHLQSLRREQGRTLWEITVEIDEQANPHFYSKIDALPDARFVGKSDRVFNRHRGGKIHMEPSLPITTRQTLHDIYTPGVARVCLAIRDDPSKAAVYTNRQNTVAVVTNGTAILGLGDIGPLAGLPVMEGKSALFAALVGITAIPILIDSKDSQHIIDTVVSIAPSFGAIQLEDIAAPECFSIEAALVERLSIPVLHDDQHGTAVVALAGAAERDAARRALVVGCGRGPGGTRCCGARHRATAARARRAAPAGLGPACRCHRTARQLGRRAQVTA